MHKVLVLHGINLNMFGKRDPAQYGTVTLADINRALRTLGKELGTEILDFQSNCEGEFCARIYEAVSDGTGAIVINAGAWTHYNYGIRDALAMFSGPIIETHMSNVHAREEFRHHSVLAPITVGQICGFGMKSYLLAVRAAVAMLVDDKASHFPEPKTKEETLDA